MKVSPAILAASVLLLTPFAYAQARSDTNTTPQQAKPAPTTHRSGVPDHAGSGTPPQPAGMAIAEQGITNSKPKHKPHTKMESSGDPHENMNGREAGSGMATGRRTADANANANAEIHAREAGSGMATGRRASANSNTQTGRETGSGMATGRRTHMPSPQGGASASDTPANGTATH